MDIQLKCGPRITDFYKIDEIADRVIHAQRKVNFGPLVGEDSVLIISPIPLA